jgi:hypothetical protein
VAEVVVGDGEAEVIGFADEDGALDGLLADAVEEKGQRVVGQMLLLERAAGFAFDLGHGDGRAAAGDAAPEAGRAHGGEERGVARGVVIEDAGHQGDDHGDDGGGDDETEDDLGGFVVLLKDADHAWLTTFTWRRAVGLSCARDLCAGCAWSRGRDTPRLLAGAQARV